MEVRKKTSGVPVRESILFALTPEIPSRLQPSRFSSWIRLVGVKARAGYFVNNCRIPISEVTGILDARELQMRKL